MKITTVLFDLDGTLTDSGPGIMNSVKYALEKAGEPVPKTDELRKFIGPPLKGQFMEHCGIDEEKAAEMVTLYREYFTVTGIFENSSFPAKTFSNTSFTQSILPIFPINIKNATKVRRRP